MAASNATRYANFSIAELDRSIKTIEIKENADTERLMPFVINTTE